MQIVRGLKHIGVSTRARAAKFRVAPVASGGWRALGDSESKIAAGDGLAGAAEAAARGEKIFFDNTLEGAGGRAGRCPRRIP